jgi:hypothetical protein
LSCESVAVSRVDHGVDQMGGPPVPEPVSGLTCRAGADACPLPRARPRGPLWAATGRSEKHPVPGVVRRRHYEGFLSRGSHSRHRPRRWLCCRHNRRPQSRQRVRRRVVGSGAASCLAIADTETCISSATAPSTTSRSGVPGREMYSTFRAASLTRVGISSPRVTSSSPTAGPRCPSVVPPRDS